MIQEFWSSRKLHPIACHYIFSFYPCLVNTPVKHNTFVFPGYPGWDRENYEEARREEIQEDFGDEDLLYALHNTFADEEADLYGPLALL
jgi:hypothetical protein